MRSSGLTLVAVFVAAIGLSACDIQAGEGRGFKVDLASGKAEETWTRTYSLRPGGHLELININGRIDAQPASGDSVELVGRRVAKAMTDERAKELLAKIEIREEVGDERIRVEVRAPRFSGMSSQSVEWTVRVPKGVHVDFKTINGGVRLAELRGGEVHARTTNGGVIGKRLQSTIVEASCVNGGIQIELASALSADGHIQLETVNGGVTLDLPEASRASISARAVNGGVRVLELDVVTQGEPNRRRLDGTLNGGGARVNLETTNGGIRVSRTSVPSS